MMSRTPSRPGRRIASGFTLIEILVVVAIMGIILAAGIPAMFRVAEKDSMRQVMNDLLDACRETRAQAILNGQVQSITFNPRDRSYSAAGKTYTIPARFVIEEIGINYVPVNDFDSAPVRFFPNSTSDEFTICLADRQEKRFVRLDSVTAMPEIESEESMNQYLDRIRRIKEQ